MMKVALSHRIKGIAVSQNTRENHGVSVQRVLLIFKDQYCRTFGEDRTVPSRVEWATDGFRAVSPG